MRLRTLSTWLFQKPRTVRRKHAAHLLGSALSRCLERLEDRLAPAICIWTGLGADDLWSNAANWDTGVPVNGDDVRIADTAESAEVLFDTSVAETGVTISSLSSDGVNPVGEPLRITGDTLTLSGAGPFAFGSGLTIADGTLSAANAVNMDALTLSGGELTGAGNVTIVGATTWTDGDMIGPGQTTTNGSLAITANNGPDLNGRTLNINGSTTMTGTSNFRGSNTAVINNAGLFDIQGDAVLLNLTSLAVPIFNNLATGTFRKSGGAGVSEVGFVVTSSGAVEANTGTLSLNAGGTSTGSLTATATLAFGGGTHDINANTSGAGTVQFRLGQNVSVAGTTNFNGGAYNVTGITHVTAGSANFNAGVNVLSVGATLNVANSFGTIDFSSGEAINATTLNMSAGTLSGSDTMTVNGGTTWTGGIMAGSGQTTTNGNLAITASNSAELASRTLNINGGASVTGLGGFPFFRANNGAVINNLALFDVQSDATLLHASASGVNGAIPTFNNTGTFQKSGGTGVTDVGFVFNSDDTVQANAGTLSLNAGGTSTGSFTTTGTLAFGGGVHTLNLSAGSSISGAGTVRFSGGTTHLNGGTYNISGSTQATGSSAVANFNAAVNLVNVGAALTMSSQFGNLNFSSGEAINATTFNMSTGTLSGSDNVTISGASTWTGGIMRGSGQTTTNGSLAITAENSAELDGRMLNINGGATLTGTSFFRAVNGAVFNNNTGVFDVQTDSRFLHVDGVLPKPIFNNLASGTFRKSAGAGSTDVDFVFNNSGVVQVNAGTLTLKAGGTSTGDWAIDSTSELRFANGTTYLLDNGTDITGAGIATLTANPTVNVGDSAADVVNIANLVNGFNFGSGTLNLVGTLNVSGVLSLGVGNVGGIISGAGDVNIAGLLTWESGEMSGSGRTFANGGISFNVAGGGLTLNGRRLDNAAAKTATWTAPQNQAIAFREGAVFNNHGLFDAQDNSRIVNGSGAVSVFNNFGTFRKSAGTGISNVNVAFNNTGAVDVQVGTASFGLGGTSTGSWVAAAPATLHFGGGTHNLNAGSSVTGGTVLVSNGTLNSAGTYDVANTQITAGTADFSAAANTGTLDLGAGNSGGTLRGSADVTVSGLTRWFSGTMTGSGKTLANGGMTFIIDGGGASLDGRRLDSAGASTWTAPLNQAIVLSNGAVFNNNGLLDAQDNSRIVAGVGAASSFNNNGTLRKSAGAGDTEIRVPFTNNGTVEVQTGAVSLFAGLTNYSAASLALTGGTYLITGTFQFDGANIVTNAASIVLSGDASAFGDRSSGASALANFATNAAAGSFTIQNGRNLSTPGAFANTGHVTIGPGSTFTTSSGNYTQTDGTTTLNGALTATTVDIQGGLLQGSPSLPGLLTINGNYTQSNAASLNIEIGGLIAGTEFDQLVVTDLATLDGTVNITRLGDFVPAALDAFRIVSSDSRAGAFATLNGSSIPGGRLVLIHDGAGVLLDANLAPTAVNDLDTTVENHAVTTNVVQNDSDPDSDALSVVNVGTSTLGITPIDNGDGTITYTPPSDFVGTDVYTYTLRDSIGNEATATVTVTITPVNTAPTLDLIQDPAEILEDVGEQTIILTGISAGGGEIQTLTVTATSSNPALIPHPIVTYISPEAAGSLHYTPAANEFGDAVITVTVKDNGGAAFGGVDEITRTFTVTVNAVPDAPIVDTTAIPMLPALPLKPAPTNPAGLRVTDLLDGVTEVDGQPLGIAITGIDNRKGRWQFSVNGGTNWQAIPNSVSATAALLLSDDLDTRVRFLPNKGFQGLSNFSYMAWDQSDSAIEGTQVNATLAPTAYSSDIERAWVAVGKTNPVVNADGATVLAAVKEDSKFSRTFSAKSLLGIAGLEQLPATNLGIAITGLSTASGKWQFRLAKAAQFVDVGTVSEASALLLRPIDTLRFVPNANADGQTDLTFKTWNQVGTAGNKVDSAATGFGVDPGFAVLDIAAVNDAPVLDLSLPAVLDPIDPSQTTNEPTLASLMSATDVEGAPLGVAIVATKGLGWEFNTGGGWNPLPIVSTLKALLLNADARIRFVAATNVSPSTATLSFKAWDQFPGSGAVGTRVPIRGTAFSKQTEVVTVAIDNDAPVLNTTPVVTLPNIFATSVKPSAGTLVKTLLGTAVTDAAKSLKGIAIVFADNTNGKWQYSLGGNVFVDIGNVSTDAALLLTDVNKLRFVPNAGFTGQATIQYKAWDRTAGRAGDRIDTDSGLNSFSLEVETATVNVV